MKRNCKVLAACIALPLAAGGLAALFSGGGMGEYAMLEQPPLSPPGWLFPVAWSLLYVLMGIASYLVLRSGAQRGEVRRALRLYGIQLAVNFFWPILFFGLGLLLISFLWLVLLWILVLSTFLSFRRISPVAGWLLAPYLLWTTFAGYLNFGVYLLN